MASREELRLLREARAGNPESQLMLGKLYLFGSKGLPKSITTALHWLGRAASQGSLPAKRLIGEHIPYDVIRNQPDRRQIEGWYRDALKDGVARAGLVVAQMLLADTPVSAERRHEIVKLLEVAAHQKIGEAQWLLAELASQHDAYAEMDDKTAYWVTQAAESGVPDARSALIEYSWNQQDYKTFLQYALPIAEEMLEAEERQGRQVDLDAQSVKLLLRCGIALANTDGAIETVQHLWETAAAHRNAEAAYQLGLWFAKMDENGVRVQKGASSTSFKKAVKWLRQAGDQGSPKAWYALALIYQKAEFSQRSMADSLDYLETAGNLGHPKAQYELGMHAWRCRRDNETNDIQAIYWLQKAFGNGRKEAEQMLDKISDRAQPMPWAEYGMTHMTPDIIASHPFLAARIELASVFGLSRPEALLLDIHQANQGHCLLVDIRSVYRHSRRRLILIRTSRQRQVLARITQLFDKVDCGLKGPEGNYRQRQYRLKTLFPDMPKE